MTDKVYKDIECAQSQDVLLRKPQTFPAYLHEQMLKTHGTLTAAAKHMVWMCNGLQKYE